MDDDLIAFVSARLDEDEATAKAAGWDTWHGWHRSDDLWFVFDSHDDSVAHIDSQNQSDSCLAAHIARHDPARVLREVAAKRAIVNNYVTCATADRYSTDPAPIDHFQDGLGWALQQIAAVWSDHSDYQAEWTL